MSPQFKPVRGLDEEVVLNNHELFWVPFEASHISFKNGKVSFWLLEREDAEWEEEERNYNIHRSRNKRTFLRKKGNCFFLPEFKRSENGAGFFYYPIKWDWRCRECLKRVSRQEILNSEEKCSQCQKQDMQSRIVI